MTDETAPTPPSGLKAKATDVGTKAFLKAPAKAQHVILVGVGKVQPVAKAVAPHTKKLVVGGVSLLALRKFRHRGE